MRITEVVEGRTKLLVPREEKLTKKNEVFYNPEMELARDISIAVVKILNPGEFCDLLAGSGARGVRVANEVGIPTVMNDLNPKAVKLMGRNCKLNDVKCRITKQDANQLLATEKFEFIDIDPFGPPVRFVDSAIRSVKNKGILAVTATDTSALCGTYPKACKRKYDSVSVRTDYYNELGLRTLIGFVARNALRHEAGIQPLFSHCTRHYLRTYVRVVKGRRSVNETLSNMRFLQHCFSCLWRDYRGINELTQECQCGGKLETAGPLWAGEFAHGKFCRSLEKELLNSELNKRNDAVKLANLIGSEQKITLPYYNIHKIFKKLRKPATPTPEIMENLAKKGFDVERTHFSGLGLRVSGDISDVIKVL